MKVQGRNETWDLEEAFQDPVAVISETHTQTLGHIQPTAETEAACARNTIQLYWRFLCAGITRHSQTGAVLPSQRFLINRMIAPVPVDYRGEIVELGAGTGVLTLRLAERCPRARILSCEINPVLARDLEARLAAAGLSRRVRVSADPAEDLLASSSKRGARPAEFVLSGIPLCNLVKERAEALIAAIHRAMSPGGLYVQFQHSLMDRQKIKSKFSSLRTGFVALNIPPAFVYYARK